MIRFFVADFPAGLVCLLCIVAYVGMIGFSIWCGIDMLRRRKNREVRLLSALTQSGGIQINILRSGKVRVTTLGGPEVSGTNIGSKNPLLVAATHCANALISELNDHPEYRRQYAPLYDALEACGFDSVPAPSRRTLPLSNWQVLVVLGGIIAIIACELCFFLM